MRRFVTTALILAVLAGIGFGAYKILTTSSVEIDLSQSPVAAANMVVRVDDKKLSADQSKIYHATVGRGDHRYSVHAPGYTYAEESFSTTVRSSQTFQPTLKEAAPDAAAQTIYKRVSNTFTIARAKFYGNKDWLVFYVSSPNNEGSIVVAHFDSKTGDWIIVSEGSEVSLGSAAANAPGDMLFDLKDVLEQ